MKPRHRLRAAALAALIAFAPSAGGPVLAALASSVPFASAEARTSRSSGGYSRPSTSGGYSRPSFSAPVPSRTPSTSGGYARPGFGAPSPTFSSPSAGDRSISRQSSSDALRNYRAQQDAAREVARRPESAPTGRFDGPRRYSTQNSYPGGGYTGGSYGRPTTAPGGWFANRGWTPPPYAMNSRPSFGIWQGVFLWFLLDTLTSPGHAAFFHNHQDDPGYREWRSEADRMARDNADLRAKLDTLDRELQEQQGKPRDPDYLPADTDPQVALADAGNAGAAQPAPQGAGFGAGMVITVVVLGAGVLFLLWLWRRRAAAGPARGASAMENSPLRSAAAMVRHKLSGESYKPSLFRVGMTVTADPTPFVLAAGVTKVTAPEAGGLISVAAVGTLQDGPTVLNRLYLPENRSFFQLHLDAAGQPDECRYFSLLDEVNPASQDEWGFWIDPAEGMIGWPEFQTRDGKTYARAWAPGETRVAPRTAVEERAELSGKRTVHHSMMLYAAPTGASDSAPSTEYILVDMVEDGDSARVEVLAGIDVNPAALSLA